MKKQIIYSDLDGTLLNLSVDNFSSFSDENINAINKWIKNGNLFSFATGRNIISIKPLIEQGLIDFNLPLVLSNGTVVYDYHNDKIIYQETLKKEIILEAINFYLNNKNIVKLTLFSPTKEYVFVEDLNEEVSNLGFDATKLTFDMINFNEITKAIFVVNPNDDNNYIIEKINNFNNINDFEIIPSGYKYIELINKGTSKYTAILKALEHVGKENYNLYTIGDFMNDLDMIKNAKISFAPLNALDEVKKHATHTVRHHNENAVSEMLDILNKKYNIK